MTDSPDGKSLERKRFLLRSLALFRSVPDDPVVRALAELLDALSLPVAEQVGRCARFAALLFQSAEEDFARHLLNVALRDDNPCARALAQGLAVPERLSREFSRELAALGEIACLTAEEIARGIDCGIPLPAWENEPPDFAACYRARAREASTAGYGVFAQHSAFRLDGEILRPVEHPDSTAAEDLTGYDRERRLVRDNTLALAEGRSAANVLLYGESGTGKSTCVKTSVLSLAPRGLRLIEVPKGQLAGIPALLDRLHGNPLKFVLFVDDLSFTAGDESYAAMKALLEGSVAAKGDNVAIYATSNRRHLIRERFSDRTGGRDGDEVHLRDTLEEQISLSDRFGLTVLFQRPDKELYISIVAGHCRRLGVPFGAEERAEAEAFALGRGGRSARVARHFAERLAARK